VAWLPARQYEPVDLRLPSLATLEGRELAGLRKQEQMALGIEGVRHNVQKTRNRYAAEQTVDSMLLLEHVGRVARAVGASTPDVRMHAEMMLDTLGAGYIASLQETLH
jgi:hypothetical protein